MIRVDHFKFVMSRGLGTRDWGLGAGAIVLPVPGALSAQVLGVRGRVAGVAKPNTQHPTPKTLLGNALVPRPQSLSLAKCRAGWGLHYGSDTSTTPPG